MTTMIAEVYDALLEAGASDGKARRAAEALAGYEDRFNRLESKIDKSEASVKADIAAVRSEQVLIRWMGGFSMAIGLAIFLKLFLH